MSPPSDGEQIAFLTKLQRLLAEGEFTASYKYALLLALSDIAVETADDSGDALQVRVSAIAERFIALYWRQAAPHPQGPVLLQNTDRQAAIVNAVATERANGYKTLAALRQDARAWHGLVARVGRTVREMPLFKLQKFGGATDDFLYPNTRSTGGIELRPGVAFCLRRFHHLIQDLVRGAWIGFVRRLPANRSVIGETADLGEFMFGSGRADLSVFEPLLRDVQNDLCFYCRKPLTGRTLEIDHFIPWSLYAIDLGHNFVLADAACNSDKSDTLAAPRHLEQWWRRSDDAERVLAAGFAERGIVHDLQASKRVTAWAYSTAAQAGAHVWISGDDYEPLTPDWSTRIGVGAIVPSHAS